MRRQERKNSGRGVQMQKKAVRKWKKKQECRLRIKNSEETVKQEQQKRRREEKGKQQQQQKSADEEK